MPTHLHTCHTGSRCFEDLWATACYSYTLKKSPNFRIRNERIMRDQEYRCMCSNTIYTVRFNSTRSSLVITLKVTSLAVWIVRTLEIHAGTFTSSQVTYLQDVSSVPRHKWHKSVPSLSHCLIALNRSIEQRGRIHQRHSCPTKIHCHDGLGCERATSPAKHGTEPWIYTFTGPHFCSAFLDLSWKTGRLWYQFCLHWNQAERQR